MVLWSDDPTSAPAVGKLVGQLAQVGEGVDLPGQVVEPDRAAPGRRVRCRGADLEQAEVVIVRRAGRAQEGGAP